LARVFLVHHVTWSINSICHLWGSQPYRTADQSRNNFVFGALGFGEGWHNNHHAFPTSARFGLRWWQIDLGYWFIYALIVLGLASKVRRHEIPIANG
jgi:stearoyl-CoA desaturase (delta-9 desaturase)